MSKYKGYFKTIVTKAKYSEENALSLAIACDLAYKKENLSRRLPTVGAILRSNFSRSSKDRILILRYLSCLIKRTSSSCLEEATI